MARHSASQDLQTLEAIHEHGVHISKRYIYLGNDHQEEDMINHRTAMKFIKNIRFLESLNSTDRILVHCLTGLGGDWESGLAVYSAIKESPCKIVCLIYGGANSMGATVVEAADLRIMHKYSSMLLHSGSIGLPDDRQEAIFAGADFYKLEHKKFINILVSRCKNAEFFKDRTEKYMAAYLERKLNSKQDLYLSPDEAIELGLIDGVLGSKEYPNLESL